MKRSVLIEGLFTDYDGTLSPINAVREASVLPAGLTATLEGIAAWIPVGVITTKDLHFIRPRTPFARAWSAVGGLEINVPPADLLDPRITDQNLKDMASVRDYARREINGAAFIEEKRNGRGQVIAFCIDWRRSVNETLARQRAERVAALGRRLGFAVVNYGEQPFIDFFPYPPNKGMALTTLKKLFGLTGGVIYLGDSKADNPAFAAADVSIGVIHPETPVDILCRYFIDFADVPQFFKALLDGGLIFSEDLPYICRAEDITGRVFPDTVTEKRQTIAP